MPDAICFAFNANHSLFISDKKTLIPQESDPEYADVAANVSFALMECGCCYSVYIPIRYEYKYREWLDIHGIVPTETKYISNLHNETKNWIYLDSEQQKFTGFHNKLIAGKNEETEFLTRVWTVTYHVANEPNKVFTFTKDVHRVSDVYKKVLELFISAIETYKDWLPQYTNWSISNNLVYAKKLNMPKQLALSHGLNKLLMFDICINGENIVKCSIC